METVKCPKCPQFNEVKVSSGYNKPKTKARSILLVLVVVSFIG